MRLFRDKPIELHCYTYRADVYNYAPIQPGRNTPREWFKSLQSNKKKYQQGLHNASSCPALRSELDTGLVMPLWSDLNLRVGPRSEEPWWKYQFSDGESELTNHTFSQLGKPEQDKTMICLKAVSPWRFMCSHDIEFMFCGDQLELLKYGVLEILHGKTGFKYQSGTNINIVVQGGSTETDVSLPFLFPILKLVPLTEKKVVVINHLITKDTWLNLVKVNAISCFTNAYYKKKAIMKKKGPFKYTTEA